MFENDDSRLSLTKYPIKKPAKNSETILIAAVFYFVDPVQKGG